MEHFDFDGFDKNKEIEVGKIGGRRGRRRCRGRRHCRGRSYEAGLTKLSRSSCGRRRCRGCSHEAALTKLRRSSRGCSRCRSRRRCRGMPTTPSRIKFAVE